MSKSFDLDALTELLERATPGDWYATSEEGPSRDGKGMLHSVCRGAYDAEEHECVADMHASTHKQTAINAHAIAELRNAAPGLLRAARAIARIEQLMEEHHRILDDFGSNRAEALADQLAIRIVKELHMQLKCCGGERS